MSKKKDHIKNKVGKPPGTLIYSGEKISKEVRVQLLKYNEELFEFIEVKSLEQIDSFLKTKTDDQKIWINVIGLTDVVFISKLGKLLGLHPLVMEDVLNAFQRPKIDVYDDYLFSVLKRINFLTEGNTEFDNYSLVLKGNIVVSF